MKITCVDKLYFKVKLTTNNIEVIEISEDLNDFLEIDINKFLKEFKCGQDVTKKITDSIIIPSQEYVCKYKDKLLEFIIINYDTYINITVSDISGLRKSFIEIKQSRNLLREMIDNTPIIAYAKNSFGQHIIVNGRYSNSIEVPIYKIYNKKNEELLNQLRNETNMKALNRLTEVERDVIVNKLILVEEEIFLEKNNYISKYKFYISFVNEVRSSNISIIGLGVLTSLLEDKENPILDRLQNIENKLFIGNGEPSYKEKLFRNSEKLNNITEDVLDIKQTLNKLSDKFVNNNSSIINLNNKLDKYNIKLFTDWNIKKILIVLLIYLSLQVFFIYPFNRFMDKGNITPLNLLEYILNRDF